jgi:hypothetical protein
VTKRKKAPSAVPSLATRDETIVLFQQMASVLENVVDLLTRVVTAGPLTAPQQAFQGLAMASLAIFQTLVAAELARLQVVPSPESE